MQLSDQFGKPYFPGQGDKPSQGKLFRDPKPTDRVRYQRGYTPERMAEVRAMPMETHQLASNAPFRGHSGERRLHEVIARSTAPVSDIQPQFNGDKLHINLGGPGIPRNATGSYQRGSYGAGQGTIRLDSYGGEKSASQTLMHELGHHRSATVDFNESSNYDTPQRKGQEEAYADDYMVRHWRPDPRDVRKDPRDRSNSPHPSYEFEGSWTDKKGYGKKGHKAYLAARQEPNVLEADNKRWKARSAGAGWQPTLSFEQFGGGHGFEGPVI